MIVTVAGIKDRASAAEKEEATPLAVMNMLQK